MKVSSCVLQTYDILFSHMWLILQGTHTTSFASITMTPHLTLLWAGENEIHWTVRPPETSSACKLSVELVG